MYSNYKMLVADLKYRPSDAASTSIGVDVFSCYNNCIRSTNHRPIKMTKDWQHDLKKLDKRQDCTFTASHSLISERFVG